MKYIDADKLKATIESIALISQTSVDYNDGREDMKMMVLDIIESLQQEQLEVDLEKEINAVWNPRFNLGWDEHSALSMNHAGFASIARHFYELGLNAKKEE